jgi:GT2 family glycosyltransferase
MTTQTRILIGSPVCQQPDVLRMFLFSLEKLSTSDMAVHYLFVDDNNDPASSRLLHHFAEKHSGQVEIIRSQEAPSTYSCNETTHIWTDELVWRVASFKNQLIERAKSGGYDGLFLLDSDLLLQPATLETLLASEKDIVSEVFWTSWTPDTLPVPQVWLTDQYTQYEINHRLESISADEQYLRKYAFYGKLRVPGLYEVGGLGACTLIRRKALESGVNYSRIHNVTFWGEDRHFCIRAVALGFSLFVDTHYPAFHLYRESDFAEATVWMKQIYGSAPLRIKKSPSLAVPAVPTSRPKITLSMVIHNEADKHLAHVLTKHREYIDEAVIIDDGSTDDSAEICHELLKGIPLHLVRNPTPQFTNEVALRKQQWKETISHQPEWIVNMDADEVFEDGFATGVHALLSRQHGDVCCFRLYDMWTESHYREDPYWRAHYVYRPFIVRYRPNLRYLWKEQPLHCGRFPGNIFELPSFLSYYRVKHLGWSSEKIRQEKYARYKLLDPTALYGWKEQYESILDAEPNLVPWRE